MSSFFDNFLLKQQCSFLKGYSTQQCFLALLEIWKRAALIGMFGALLNVLSKAPSNAYGFSLPALKLVNDYLSNRKQGTKLNRTYSSWLELVFGVPQGSIRGQLLFNIFLADLLFLSKDVDIANNAYDSTPYIIADDINGVIASSEKAIFIMAPDSSFVFELLVIWQSKVPRCFKLLNNPAGLMSVHYISNKKA